MIYDSELEDDFDDTLIWYYARKKIRCTKLRKFILRSLPCT